MASMDNEKYYDTFSTWYERERHRGYHKTIDDIEFKLVAEACRGREVLELGCGTGAILKEVAPIAKRAIGIDISAGMLEQAKERGLECVQGSVTDLPFEDESFDLAYSFKVLAHIEDIKTAMRECRRVLRPGGEAFLEFYNRFSVRYLAKRLGGPGAVASDNTKEDDVFVRWDSPKQVRNYLPENLVVKGSYGVRVFTPAAFTHRLPIVGPALSLAEKGAARCKVLAPLGGFYVVHVEAV